jgi:hypothetical protein
VCVFFKNITVSLDHNRGLSVTESLKAMNEFTSESLIYLAASRLGYLNPPKMSFEKMKFEPS